MIKAIFGSTMLLSALLMASSAQAQLAHESFSYADGQLSTLNAGTGFSGAWSVSGTGTGGPGNWLVTGGAVQGTNPSTGSAAGTRSLPATGMLANDGDSLYFGARMTITSGTPDCTIGLMGAGGGYGFGFAGTNAKWWNAGLTTLDTPAMNTPVHAIGKITRVDSGADQVTLWVNAASETDPVFHTTTATVLTSGQTDFASISVYLGAINSGTHSCTIDDFAVGKTFASVANPGSSIPTLSEWGMLAMLALLAGSMVYAMRRKPASA